MIDFVMTTPFVVTKTEAAEGSQAFQWWRKVKVFQQYNTKQLQSGVADTLRRIEGQVRDSAAEIGKGVAEATRESSEKINQIESRIDTFVVLLFTVVAVLFAALGVVATKGSDDPSFVSSPVWVAAVALYFALRAYAAAFPRQTSAQGSEVTTNKWYLRLFRKFEFVVTGIVVVASIGYHIWDAHISAKEIRSAKEQAAQALSGTETQRRILETETLLRQRSDARVESLQQQLNLLLQNEAKKK